MSKAKQKGPGRPKKGKAASVRKREEENRKKEALGHEKFRTLKTQKMAEYRGKMRDTGETSFPKTANERKQEQRKREIKRVWELRSTRKQEQLKGQSIEREQGKTNRMHPLQHIVELTLTKFFP